jgi:hypothetical protein
MRKRSLSQRGSLWLTCKERKKQQEQKIRMKKLRESELQYGRIERELISPRKEVAEVSSAGKFIYIKDDNLSYFKINF